MTQGTGRRIRCAIYTRKSSEEGLEQDFNSLDAQREACAAYVLSQASEGWTLLSDHYDDGGLSGGTLERPALRRLLADVSEGRIDIIVVYKVDRLTRSLLDFAKLVEALDAAQVSFVSVTQSFNTTTSMGRLTLNMLLSFAQFEREVTAERIRDKIAQSKAKGMWMGGTPPLGYEPDGRSLKVVEQHAAIVSDIFARYLVVGNVRLVAEALASQGIRTPRRQSAVGKSFGGCAFTRGQLYQILRNPIYAGDIPHKGKTYPGNHQGIISREQWDTVQLKLSDNVKGTRQAREASSALLASRLFDADGEPLIPVHTSKPGPGGASTTRMRYRYYVSKAAHFDASKRNADSLRIPAQEIEQVVRKELLQSLSDPLAIIAQLAVEVPPARFEHIASCLELLRGKIRSQGTATARNLIERVIIKPERLELVLIAQGLIEALGLEASPETPPTITRSIQVRLTTSGNALRLVDDSGVSAGSSCAADPTLTGLLLQARSWWCELSQGDTDIASLARKANVTASYMTRVVRLAFLAPQVVEAILAGRTRADLDGKALLATGAIDPNWSKQAANLLPGV